MSTPFYDLASLVVVPSGYKASKVYAQKPLTTDGQLSFSRSTDATRVASSGLIEKVRTNVALYSEDQTNWTVQNETSVTANAAANPLNGAVTADKVIPSTTTDDHYRGLSMGSMIGEISSSIYVKADGYSIIDYGVYNSTAGNYPVRAVFDLSTQAITYINGSIASITSVGSGWYRISVTASVASTSTMGIFHRVRPSGTGGTYAGDGTSGMLLWGCQLESGVTTPYIGPTTSAAVSVGPVANVPRLDYLNSSCPRLLLEPQRTNALSYSEDFSNAAYTKGQSSITSNAAIAPDGTMSADKLVEDTSNNPHVIYRSPSGTGATFSFFAKAAERNWVGVLSNNGNISFFNIANGTLGTIAANSTATITPYGNGWYRCTLYNTHGTFGMTIYLATANGTDTYTGDGTSGAFIWGCQLETSAAYATSYISTQNSAVTRGADACSKTGISSLIGQTEGTLFVEANLQDSTGSGQAIATIYEDSSNVIILYKQNDNVLKLFVVTAGTLVADLGAVAVSGTIKIAAAYKANDFVLYINGTQRGTDTSGSVPACSKLYLGADDAGAQKATGTYNQALLFKTRLTNAQLAELTTL